MNFICRLHVRNPGISQRKSTKLEFHISALPIYILWYQITRIKQKFSIDMSFRQTLGLHKNPSNLNFKMEQCRRSIMYVHTSITRLIGPSFSDKPEFLIIISSALLFHSVDVFLFHINVHLYAISFRFRCNFQTE